MSDNLSCQDLVKRYDDRAVVDGVNIDVSGGEIVGLLGPNGAGKTTTFLMVVGLIQPEQGAIFLGERQVTELPMYRRAREGIGYLPQEPSVFRHLTVEDNFRAVLELVDDDSSQHDDECERLLDEFDLNHVRDTRGASLSGGERRRVEIGRALIPDPDFLLLDEPFAGVDPIAVEEVQEIVLMLKNLGIGVFITDHNVRETLKITDRSYIMNEGEILISGDAETLVNDETARKIYLGDSFDYAPEGGHHDA